MRSASTSPLFQGAENAKLSLNLPATDGREEVFADYQTTGVSLKAHPILFFGTQLDELRIAPAIRLASLSDGCYIRVGGLVLVCQRPGTAKGITFVTLEDETGVANLIIRMDVWEGFYRIARTAPAYIAGERLQNQQGVIHVLASRLENLNEAINGLRSSSRNFQ